jgi:hypothetical protein
VAKLYATDNIGVVSNISYSLNSTSLQLPNLDMLVSGTAEHPKLAYKFKGVNSGKMCVEFIAGDLVGLCVPYLNGALLASTHEVALVNRYQRGDHLIVALSVLVE